MNVMERTLVYGSHKLTIRPWAGGKVLLMSADERVKDEWISLRAREEGLVELLTDPDTRVCAEDLEGVMCVIVDPKRLVIIYDLESGRLSFAECCIAEDKDHE